MGTFADMEVVGVRLFLLSSRQPTGSISRQRQQSRTGRDWSNSMASKKTTGNENFLSPCRSWLGWLLDKSLEQT